MFVVVMEKLNLKALTRDDHEKADIQEQIKSIIATKLQEMSYIQNEVLHAICVCSKSSARTAGQTRTVAVFISTSVYIR